MLLRLLSTDTVYPQQRIKTKEDLEMNNKLTYECPEVTVTPLSAADVIKTSGAFDGKIDLMSNW